MKKILSTLFVVAIFAFLFILLGASAYGSYQCKSNGWAGVSIQAPLTAMCSQQVEETDVIIPASEASNITPKEAYIKTFK